jgi:uncharacterized protein (DUF2164 family)
MARRPSPTLAIRFSKEETAALVRSLQGYFDRELEQTLGDIPAQMLLDFIVESLGPAIYNRALYDAQAVVAARLDELGDAILGLEK